MTEPSVGLLLVVPGGDANDLSPQCGLLGQALAQRSGRAVVLCPLEAPGEPLIAGIRGLIGSGAQCLVVMPVFPASPQDQARLDTAIQWSSRRWPFLTFHRAAPPGWQEWAGAVVEVAREAQAALKSHPSTTAVLILGPGACDSLVNADLARLAHLVQEQGDFARVDHAFLATARPDISQAIALLARLDMRHAAVVPWLPPANIPSEQIADQVLQVGGQHGVQVSIAPNPLTHPCLLDLLLSHCEDALKDESLLPARWDDVMAEVARGTGSNGQASGQPLAVDEEVQIRELDRRINELLPPQYLGRYDEVSAQSMGSAPVLYGPDGMVAWDQMWTSFCDLALAGGPPHRGTLLEAVSASEALADGEKYRAVVAEIERGIKLVTGLPVVPSESPGWVGICCDSEDMAIWLMRAIIVENVMVRREGDVIYLPAGPGFTVKREIKNVVTVVAKTCHYWTAHLTQKQKVQPLNPTMEAAS